MKIRLKGLKIGETLDRLSLLSRVLVLVLGTKDKTVVNKVSEGLQKAKQVKDALSTPDETL
jgi:hypothetical protein